MEPEGTTTAAGIVTMPGGHLAPFSGTFTITPHKPSWWQRVVTWLRNIPR